MLPIFNGAKLVHYCRCPSPSFLFHYIHNNNQAIAFVQSLCAELTAYVRSTPYIWSFREVSGKFLGSYMDVTWMSFAGHRFINNHRRKHMGRPKKVAVEKRKPIKRKSIKNKKLDFVIVRTYSAGVFAGELASRAGKEATIMNAIRLWHWEGAATLSQLAMEGVKNP